MVAASIAVHARHLVAMIAARSQNSTTNRRWPRFSLRTFLILILVVGGGLGLIGRTIAEAAARRRVLAEIQAFGGACFDSSHPVGFKTRGFFFHSLGSVQFLSNRVSDADLEHLLPYLKRLPKLDQLILWDTQVTDDGLRHISELSELRSLDLGHLNITDAGMEQVESLTNLENLNLSDTKITDAGLNGVGRLSQLRVLDLSNTGITDAGLACLEGLSKLQILCLQQTQITDAGLQNLQHISGLKALFLANVSISDAGLKHLEGLKNLRSFWIVNTKVTDTGVQELRIALPNLFVEINGVYMHSISP
jgi:hypothetical protein